MKKPKRPKPKAKQVRAVAPAAPPRRALLQRSEPSRSAAFTARRRATVSAGYGSTLALLKRSVVQSATAARHMIGRVAEVDVGRRLSGWGAQGRAHALPFSHDERQVLALLFIPVLLVAAAIAANQSLRGLGSYLTSIAVPDQEIAWLQNPTEATARPAPPSSAIASPVATSTKVPEAKTQLAAAPPIESLTPPLTGLPPQDGIVAAAPPDAMAFSQTIPAITQAPPSPPVEATRETVVALIAPKPSLFELEPTGPGTVPALEADDAGQPIHPGICRIEDRAPASIPASFAPIPKRGEAFGRRLAEAAESQLGSFVIYTDAYRSIRYPMGDVNPFFGVCTDVVVRAYRAVGIDLQAQVQQARAGRGDRNIDHRRTEVLRRFFTLQGESLPVTAFPEDYRPGDIVTYHRPQNQRSRSHIAIVSNVIAPSGRPMIVHNRGWGPQLEDALFVDEITGHYRYSGPAETRNAASSRRPALSGAPVLPASFSEHPDDRPLRAE